KFFFSSRRRHTRSKRDWSSDVCSSDLEATMLEDYTEALESIADNGGVSGSISEKAGQYTVPKGYHDGTGKVQISTTEQQKIIARSEERRVGKECRARKAT